MMTGVQRIAAERKRQKAKWTAEHDDRHTDKELASAAAHLAAPRGYNYAPAWAKELWHKHRNNRVRELAIAGALIAAEIDRLQREAQR